MKSKTPPRPIEVRPVHLWRSTDGAPLGYFPGIFSTVGKSQTLSFLISGFVGVDPFDALDAKLYESKEACMAAWEQSGLVEVKKGTLVAMGITPEAVEQINELGLYRDPTLVVGDNPWEPQMETAHE